MTLPLSGPSVRAIATHLGHLSVHDSGGSGRPLLLWPSLFTDHALYEPVIQRLGPEWRTLAVDAPGFGQSDPLPAGTGPLAPASAVPDLLDALELATVTFAGTSWGGQVGAAFAAAHPDRVHALLMMNTPLRPSLGGFKPQVAMARLFVRQDFFAGGVANAMLGETTRKRSPEILAAFKKRFAGFTPRHAATTTDAVMRRSPGLADILPRIACPTTLLYGAEDRACPLANQEALANSVPGARVRVLDRCGHLSPLEAPAEVVAELARFV